MVLSLKNKTGQKPITPPFHRLTVLFNKTAIKCANKKFYEDDIRKSGWCFTCVDEAKEGEPGFCSQEFRNNYPKEQDMDHFKHNYRHWGICDDHCEDYLELTDGGRNVESIFNQMGGMYTETNLDIAAEYECKEYLSEIKPSEEFCAGGRIQINVDIYKVDSNVTSNSSDVYRMTHRLLNQGSFGVIDACQ